MKRTTAITLVLAMGIGTPAAARRDRDATKKTGAPAAPPTSQPASQPASKPTSRSTKQPMPGSTPRAAALYRRALHLPLLREMARPQLSPATLRKLVRAAGRTHDVLWLGPLRRLTRHHSIVVRRAVIAALADMARPLAVPLLIELVQRETPPLAAAATRALGSYPLPKVRSYLHKLAALPRLRASLRLAAVDALAAHRTREARRALGYIAPLGGPVGQAARRAADKPACERCREPAELLALRDLLGARGAAQRIVALAQLVTRAPARALDPVLYASYATTTRLRHAALSALVRLSKAKALAAPARGAARKRIEARLLTFLAAGDAREQPMALSALRMYVESVAVRRELTSFISSSEQPAALRRRAIAALAKRDDPALRRALSAVFEREHESAALRLDAARALAAQPKRPASLARALWKRRKARDKRLRRGTQLLLATHFPAELKRFEAELAAELARRPRPPDRRGFFPLLTASAVLGATGFYALAKGGGGAQPGVAALSGGVLASGSAFLLTRKGPITLERFGTFSTLAGWGTLAGLGGGLSARLERHLAWPVVGGQVAGVIAGMIAMRATDWRGGDIVFVNYSTAQAVIGGLGLRWLLRLGEPVTTGERLTRGLVGGLAPASALLVSSLVTRRVDIDARAGALLTYGSLLGGSFGALLGSSAFNTPDASTTGGGFALGEASGYFATLLATQLARRPGPAEQGWLWMASASSATALGSAALMFPDLRGRAARGMAASGLALGATLGALSARPLALRSRDVPLSLVGSAAGGFIGAFIPGLLRGAERDALAIGGGAAMGAASGLLASHIISRLADVDGRTAGAIAGSTAAAGMLGGGIALLAQPETSVRARSALIQSITGAGLVLGATVAPRLRLSGSDIALTSSLAVYSATAAAIAPALWRDAPSERDRAGGILVGVGLGTIIGASVAQGVELHGADVAELTVFSAGGFALGGGLSLLTERGERTSAALLEVGGALGLAAGALLAPRLRYSGRDAGLMALLTTSGAVQGLLLADIGGPGATGRQRAGGLAVGASSALLASALVAQASDMHPADSAQAAGAMLVGDAIGAGVGYLVGAPAHDAARAALISGSAMLVGGGLLAPLLDYSKPDALLITQLGVGGALQGTMFADIARADVSARQRGGGALIGLGAGVLAGALVAQGSELSVGDSGEMALGLVAGDALAGGVALLSNMSRQNALRTMLIGGTAIWLGAGLRAPSTRYSKSDHKLIAFAGLGGSMLGSFIPVYKSGDFGDVAAREVGGGAAAGLGGGLILGSLLAQHVELSPGASTEMALVGGGGMLFGAGLGMMLPVSDHRPIVGLMQGAGVVGALTGGLLADRTQFSGPDRLLTTLAVAYGGWQGVGASLLFGGSDRQVAGAVMATAGLGYLGGALVSQFLDMSYTEVWTLFSGSIWGAWIGGFAANLARNKGADLSGRHITGITMLASDAGILLSALTLTPLLGWTPARLGWVNLSGMLGMSLATGIGAAFSGEAAQIGTISGAVGGLTAGVIITSLMSWASPANKRARRARRDAIAASPRASTGHGSGASTDDAARAALPSGLGKIIADWAPLVRVEPPMDLQGRPVSDGMQLTVGVTGVLH